MKHKTKQSWTRTFGSSMSFGSSMLVVKPQRKRQKRTNNRETVLIENEIKHNTYFIELSIEGSEGMQSVDLEETINYQFSSSNTSNDISNWKELIKNSKNILNKEDIISIEIDVSYGINAKCIQFINAFFKSIGTRNCAEIFSLSTKQTEINQALIQLLMSNKLNQKYKLIQHIIECDINNDGLIKIKLNLNYEKYISNSSDSQYQRFKNQLSNEICNILGLDVDLFVYKKMNKGSIWVFFRFIGDYLSLAFSHLNKTFHAPFIINGNKENDNIFMIDDLVIIKYKNNQYDGKIIGIKKYKNNDKYDVTVQYLNANFLFSNTETLDAKNPRIRLKQPDIDHTNNGYIDGEIQGSNNKLLISLKWIKPKNISHEQITYHI